MSAPVRYAQDTKVTVLSSQGEMTSILMKHGVVDMGWLRSPDGDTLMFSLGGHAFRFVIAKPTPEGMRERDGRYYTYPDKIDWAAKAEAEWRRVWRAHVMLLKTKMEFVEGGDATLEQEFLPHLVLKDGRTMTEMIASGGLPLLTAGGKKS